MRLLYVMSNNALTNLVKCGYSEDPIKRAKQLSTASPEQYKVEAMVKIPDNKTDKDFFRFIEKIFPDCIHTRDIDGVIKRTEYIKLQIVSMNEIVQLMKEFAAQFYDNDSYIIEKNNKTVSRRPNFSFEKLGIKTGDSLYFRNKNSVYNGTKVVVINDTQILFNNKPFSTSALAQEFLKVAYPVNGNRYFYYNNQSISDLREDLEFSNDN